MAPPVIDFKVLLDFVDFEDWLDSPDWLPLFYLLLDAPCNNHNVGPEHIKI